ncbi:HET-domain-containing protein [Whalleya microplaca]|nr:HET-domain-containing protein [Whalleya microplaca]
MTHNYTYSHSLPNSIRLVELGSELKDGKPQLLVKACARDDAPKYVSIFYCWGQDVESELIYLNGQVFTSNAKEKTMQVSRIEQTYLTSTTVAAWLGRPDESENIERGGKDHTYKLSSPDFELILAENIILLYGNIRLPWNGVVGPLQAWSTLGKSKWRHNATMDLIHIGYALGELIRNLEHSGSTDPRGRILALLGLVDNEERNGLGAIFPDYTMSHEKVILITMAYLNQVYASCPFRWAIKPRQVWNHRVFRLDETWQALWAETEGYKTPHDLTNYTSIWEKKSISRLL